MNNDRSVPINVVFFLEWIKSETYPDNGEPNIMPIKSNDEIRLAWFDVMFCVFVR